MSAPKIVNVAVGILMRPDGQVLLGQRPAGKPYEGWWEFPGGKFEPGEDAAQAAVRELEEELDIHVLASQPWVVREHVYEHAHVRLHFRRVTAWEGEPRGREGQQLAWRALDAIDVEPLLPASLDPIRCRCQRSMPFRMLRHGASMNGCSVWSAGWRGRGWKAQMAHVQHLHGYCCCANPTWGRPVSTGCSTGCLSVCRDTLCG